MLQNSILFYLFLVAQSYSQEKLNFGEKINNPKITPISVIMNEPEKYKRSTVSVKGIITDVCSHRGCWMKIQSDKKFQNFMIKVRDGDMVFPLTLRGRIAIATGRIKVIKLSKEKAIKYFEHLSKESGGDFDQKSITGETNIYQLVPNSVEII